MRSNSWLYHYYTVQSKLQYSLALQESHAAVAASATAAGVVAATRIHQPAYYQTVMAYPPHPHLPPETVLQPQFLHHHPPHTQPGLHHPHPPHRPHHYHHHLHHGLSSLNGSQHYHHHLHSSTQSSPTTSQYASSAFGLPADSAYSYHQTPVGGNTQSSQAESPPTSPVTSYPRLTSLATSWTSSTNETSLGSSPTSTTWFRRNSTYDHPQYTSAGRQPSGSADTSMSHSSSKEPVRARLAQKASNSMNSIIESPVVQLGVEAEGAGRGSLQVMSSHAALPHAMQFLNAKNEQKVRQLGGRIIHHNTSGTSVSDDDDCVRCGRDDIVSAIPSPSQDPQTVPDLSIAVTERSSRTSYISLNGKQLRSVHSPEDTLRMNNERGDGSLPSRYAYREQFFPYGQDAKYNESAMEQYVPDIVRHFDDETFQYKRMSEFYMRNSTTGGYWSSVDMSHQLSLGKNLHHRYQQPFTSLVTTSDGESVSLLTSPSPSHSSGSPDSAVPHTPETWPSTPPFGAGLSYHYNDVWSRDDVAYSHHKRQKLSSTINHEKLSESRTFSRALPTTSARDSLACVTSNTCAKSKNVTLCLENNQCLCSKSNTMGCSFHREVPQFGRSRTDHQESFGITMNHTPSSQLLSPTTKVVQSENSLVRKSNGRNSDKKHHGNDSDGDQDRHQ